MRLRLHRVLGVLLLVACGSAKSLPIQTNTGEIVDPRCITDASVVPTPTLRLVTDAGLQADNSYLLRETVEVRVEGVAPCAPVDLVFALRQGGHSYGRFRSDFDGTVSTARDAPLEGTWSVADPEGPLWSMIDDQGGSPDVSVFAQVGQGAPLELTWKRRSRISNSDILPVRGYKGVFGDLYLPPGQGPFPGLVVFGGSEGGLAVGKALATTFVNEGYLVLAISYFDPENPALPASLESIPLEYFGAAIEVLKEHPDLRAGRIGLVGQSRGGEGALLIGAQFNADVKAVIGLLPSGLIWPAWNAWDHPSWTVADAGVTFVPSRQTQVDVTLNDAGIEVFSQSAVFRGSLALATPAELSAAEIAVEHIQGPVLLIGAQDDQVWPSCQLAQLAWNRLVDAGHTQRFPDDELACVANSGHTLSPANVGLPAGDSNEVVIAGVRFKYGGTTQGNGQGNREAWRRSIRFLERTLKGN